MVVQSAGPNREEPVSPPTQVYREVPVAPPLQSHFQCAWVRNVPDHAALPLVIIPDGHVDLIWMDGTIRVAGPDRVYHRETPPTGGTRIGFRLRVGHAAAWLGVPLTEIVDQRVELAELWGHRARRLADELGDIRDPNGVMRRLGEALTRRSVAVAGPAPAMAAAHELLVSRRPPDAAPVRWLTAELNMSERSLRRHFDETFGYGPKVLDRVLRFQRFLRLVGTPGELPIARLAAAAGYADQAHLTRECRRLAATTPAELARRYALAADKSGLPRS